MDIRDKYRTLNESFDKKLVFHIGAQAGFFSEYNNMILAMVYCLKHEIQFILYSADANFGYNKGWTDYFLPFCTETHNTFHHKHNLRLHQIADQKKIIKRKKRKARVILFKFFYRIDFFTQDLWRIFRATEMETDTFCIPQLGINGSLQDACRVLIDITWRYNNETEEAIGNKIKTLNLPTSYTGLHIRRGDKVLEQEAIELANYMHVAQSVSETKNAFVLTDDYTSIEELHQSYPQWHIYTLCASNERGYDHLKFVEGHKETIKNAHQNLFASMDIISKATVFIGTFGANPGMYLGMRMTPDRCIGLDLAKWQIR